MPHESTEVTVTCPSCGNPARVTLHLTPAGTRVEGPPVHWLADSCKPSDPTLERLYTINKDEVTCLLCKIKCRLVEKENGS